MKSSLHRRSAAFRAPIRGWHGGTDRASLGPVEADPFLLLVVVLKGHLRRLPVASGFAGQNLVLISISAHAVTPFSSLVLPTAQAAPVNRERLRASSNKCLPGIMPLYIHRTRSITAASGSSNRSGLGNTSHPVAE